PPASPGPIGAATLAIFHCVTASETRRQRLNSHPESRRSVELWKRVTVGPDVFEALSSEERISILKLLDQNRQMTGTDVANSLTISKSSAFKQLKRLA